MGNKFTFVFISEINIRVLKHITFTPTLHICKSKQKYLGCNQSVRLADAHTHPATKYHM